MTDINRVTLSRALSPKNLLDKTHKLFEFGNQWAEVFGQPEQFGAWIIYGNEKNGKTWFALLLAKHLAQFQQVLYVSAEEGTGAAFCQAVGRAGITDKTSNILFLEYESIDELRVRLSRRQAAKVVFIDNVTIYADELKNGVFRKLLHDFPSVLFVFLAHEERNEPTTATGKLIKKLAKIIVRVQGLAANVGGRCKGGNLIIDEERAALFHGQNILQQ
ncbi:hypothetical protein SAMN05421780_101577 [Flexibacter flexilis DSM 6793]|uniref:AAA+ ATPase domain-containing protein n=1 Tax=Flexibacter flexilis DSM 6793 TaxID=927664 RepID=A0A1I1E1C0_9BACT|nr:hypothetical protein [Flexibacter flexilis]SFB80995.1 hypothetical protein SAMN05421780_101577 [Flexibacter flexilis DSM 6793]